MELYELSLHEVAKKIKDKEVSIKEVLDSVYSRIDYAEEKVGAYLSLCKERAYRKGELLQERLDRGEDIGILGGVPIAIKDNICIKDMKATCSSKMLENFVSPYDATVITMLEKAGAIIIGKTNMDEFAMGSSTATSYFKKTKNPWDLERVPGGSSGGSAAVVSSDMAFASLGSDTGGSIRQPASFCSVVGMKPTYGLVSRFGLIAFASSLDQIGPFTKDVEDMAIMLNAIVGHDKMDTTSVDLEKKDYTKYLDKNISGMKIGVPRDIINGLKNEEVKKAYFNAIDVYKSLGAEIIDVSLEYMKYSLSTYYIIATAEASSNLGRYDGIKYGYRTEKYDDLLDIYKNSRTEGFGEEVKRRIMLGTYVLSSGYYDAYYKKAQKVRTLIINDFRKAFESVDVIVMPTAPNTAFKFGEKTANPVDMYLEDILTVPVNIAGLPGASIPAGFDQNNMPIGLQIISNAFEEEKIVKAAYAFEKSTEFNKARPSL
ncbi:MAG: Asp-tRNA(Asn)/Glu-tRNA(Gln) amidotransferase subunit GatA [Clostridia bacterium]|nr:Asp-tRNA(Asn)/Glu-tRNA(Gln) amidotransferase subunit GatA [Clostridia bacterium]